MAPPNVDNMFTLKVDNVPFQIGNDELKELFAKFGEIGDIYIPRARGTTESRGFAFVRFMEKRDAEDAIQGMEGQEFQGRELRVQFAKQRRPDNPREYYSRGGDGYGGGDYRRDDRYEDRRGDRYGDRYGGDRYGDRDRRDDRGRGRHDDRDRRYRSRSRSPDRRDRSRGRDHGRGGYGGGRDRSRSRHRSRSPRRE